MQIQVRKILSKSHSTNFEYENQNDNDNKAYNSKGTSIRWSAVGWLALTVFAIIAPLLLNAIICGATWNFEKFYLFRAISNGELYIYAVSLLTPIIYIINIVINKSSIAQINKKLPYKWPLGLLVTSLILHTLVTVLNMADSPGFKIRPIYTTLTSILIFTTSIVSAYKIRAFEEGPELNIKEELEEEKNSLIKTLV